MERLVGLVGDFFEFAGILVICAGTLWAVVRTIRHHGGQPLMRLRTDLAQGVLLGLEFLVAADIVRTVSQVPSLEGIIVLGLVVLIRTFLSISLEMEIDGRWPWNRTRDERRERRWRASLPARRQVEPPERPTAH